MLCTKPTLDLFNWKRFRSIAWETNHNTITSVISHISQLQQGLVLSNKKSSQVFSLIFHLSRVYIKWCDSPVYSSSNKTQLLEHSITISSIFEKKHVSSAYFTDPLSSLSPQGKKELAPREHNSVQTGPSKTECQTAWQYEKWCGERLWTMCCLNCLYISKKNCCGQKII